MNQNLQEREIKRCRKCGLASSQYLFPCDREGFDAGDHDFSQPISLREKFLNSFPKSNFTKEQEDWFIEKNRTTTLALLNQIIGDIKKLKEISAWECPDGAILKENVLQILTTAIKGVEEQ